MSVRIPSLASVGHLTTAGPTKPAEDNLPQANKGSPTSQPLAVNNLLIKVRASAKLLVKLLLTLFCNFVKSVSCKIHL